MFEDTPEEQSSSSSNVIPDETGELDVRFALWRKFCADNQLAVETLPSELSEEAKAEWEKLKASNLSKPDESH
ncbi:MAG: hypothetical protein WAV47_16185 [Blastocatellia bacterium]